MSRQNDVGELLRRISKVEMIRPVQSGGAITTETTVSTALAEAAVSYPVVAFAGFTTNSPVILVGDGGVEANQVATGGASPLTMLYKTEFAHATGARLILAEKILLGEIATGSVSENASQSSTDVESETSDVVLATDVGPLSLDISFGLLGFNNENDLLRFGQRESVRGAGTAADPSQSSVGGKGRDIVGPNVFRFSGVRRDGKLFTLDCLNATLTPNGSVTYGKSGTSFPIAAKITHRILRIWAP